MARTPYHPWVSRVKRLVIVLLLNVGLVIALVVVGLTAQSLGVFATGVDCLADVVIVGASLLATYHPSQRAPNIAALANAGWMLAVCVAIAVAAIWHLSAGTHHVDGLGVLIVSGVTALVMLAGALVLGGDLDDDDDDPGDDDLNFKVVLLDTAGDAAIAAGVAVSGAIIFATGGLYWLDPATALVIAAIVGYHAARLFWKAAAALRRRPPTAPAARSGCPLSARSTAGSRR